MSKHVEAETQWNEITVDFVIQISFRGEFVELALPLSPYVQTLSFSVLTSLRQLVVV
jgi:hypothetical protein